MNITGISLFIEVDGRQCFAPIKPECAEIFIGMLAAFQDSDGRAARLLQVPDSVWQHVKAAGRAMDFSIKKSTEAA